MRSVSREPHREKHKPYNPDKVDNMRKSGQRHFTGLERYSRARGEGDDLPPSFPCLPPPLRGVVAASLSPSPSLFLPNRLFLPLPPLASVANIIWCPPPRNLPSLSLSACSSATAAAVTVPGLWGPDVALGGVDIPLLPVDLRR